MVTSRVSPSLQELETLLQCWPTGIDARALLLEDLVAAFQLLKLNVEALPNAAHPRIADEQPLPFPFS